MSRHPFHDTVGPDAHRDPRPGAPGPLVVDDDEAARRWGAAMGRLAQAHIERDPVAVRDHRAVAQEWLGSDRYL